MHSRAKRQDEPRGGIVKNTHPLSHIGAVSSGRITGIPPVGYSGGV